MSYPPPENAPGQPVGSAAASNGPPDPTAGFPTRFDVFLSHNSRDKPAVERLAERLKRQGLEPWLDKWWLTPGGNWQNELMEGIRASRACAFFIGPHGEGAWAREELHVALDRAAKDKEFRLFLVLLPGVAEPFDTTSLPPFLSTRTWVDLRKGVEDARSFQTLLHAIKGIPLGPEVPIAPRDDVCPYRGLESFDEEHAEYFFGRDADVQRLQEKLKTSRFLAVLGASGSGKSSLVRAGLIPALKRGVLPGSERWPIRVLTPGGRPLEALAALIVRMTPDGSIQRILQGLQESPETLHLSTTLAMAQRPAGERTVWIVDQAEELFTLCHEEDARAQFLESLLYAASVPEGRCVVVVAMRADFYHRCSAYPEFSTRMAAHQFLVTPMDRDGLRQSIEEPARRVGLEFEPGLVATILTDLEAQPGALPLLQHALLELWERRRGYMLTLEAYRESGGVHGSIAQRADTVFTNLTPQQQEIARRTFLRLTQPGEETVDTRRRASLAELRTSDEESEEIEAVLKELADARLVTTSVRDDAPDPQVDLSHEALIRSWPRFRQWLEEDRATRRIHHRLTQAAIDWTRSDRDEAFLYRGSRLTEVLEWREQQQPALNEMERAFLDASVALRDREIEEREAQRLTRERLRRRITLALGVGLLLAVGLAGLAAAQWRTAEAQRRVAFGRQVAAQAEVLRNGSARLLPHSALLAAEAMSRLEVPEAEQTLRRALGLLASPLATLTHPDAVQAAVFSPDGRLLATAGRDGTARLWDGTSGRELAQLAHDDALLSVAFGAEGRLLATGSADGTARLWNTENGQQVARLAHDGPVRVVSVSSDRRLLATVSGESEVRLWDVTSHQQVARLPHSTPVRTLTFSGDGRVLATTGQERTAHLWDVATRQEIGRFPHVRPERPAGLSSDGRLAITVSGEFEATIWSLVDAQPLARLAHPNDPVLAVAFAPNGNFVATGTSYGTARVWERESGREVAKLLHETEVYVVVFSPDGRYLATASADATARVWDHEATAEVARTTHDSPTTHVAFGDGARYLVTLADGRARLWEVGARQELARLAHDGELVGVVFSGDGRTVATGSRDGSARLWDAHTGQELGRFPHDSEVLAVAMSADGNLLATAARDGIARVWDTGSRQELGRVTHAQPVNRLAFSRDGRFLASGGADRTARVFDVVSRQELARFDVEDAVNALAFSPDGRQLAVASSDVQLFDLATRRAAAHLPHGDGPVMNLALSPDGRLLGTASWQRAARLWDVSTGQEQVHLPHRSFLWTISFSPDGKYFATASTDGLIRVWESSTLQELPSRSHDNAFVFNVAFSPDGRLIATASRDRTARLWDTVTGRELARLPHADDVVRVAFRPDGQAIASASTDGTGRLWRAAEQDLVAQACTQVPRNLTRAEWRQYLGEEPYRLTCSTLGEPTR